MSVELWADRMHGYVGMTKGEARKVAVRLTAWLEEEI